MRSTAVALLDLLEKSRVTYQQPGVERNYHIFYWLLSGLNPEFVDKLLVQHDPALYHFINQGCLTVDNMDDQEEMGLVHVSKVLLFSFSPSYSYCARETFRVWFYVLFAPFTAPI